MQQKVSVPLVIGAGVVLLIFLTVMYRMFFVPSRGDMSVHSQGMTTGGMATGGMAGSYGMMSGGSSSGGYGSGGFGSSGSASGGYPSGGSMGR